MSEENEQLSNSFKNDPSKDKNIKLKTKSNNINNLENIQKKNNILNINKGDNERKNNVNDNALIQNKNNCYINNNILNNEIVTGNSNMNQKKRIILAKMLYWRFGH